MHERDALAFCAQLSRLVMTMAYQTSRPIKSELLKHILNMILDSIESQLYCDNTNKKLLHGLHPITEL